MTKKQKLNAINKLIILVKDSIYRYNFLCNLIQCDIEKFSAKETTFLLKLIQSNKPKKGKFRTYGGHAYWAGTDKNIRIEYLNELKKRIKNTTVQNKMKFLY